MKLIFIYGLPGVGKYTVAQELVRKTGIQLFHNHMVLDLIIDVFGLKVRPIVELREKIWLDFFKQAVREDIRGMIFTFVFDKYLQEGFLDRLEAVVPAENIHYIELTCTLDALKERVMSRNIPNKINSFASLKEQIADRSFFVPELDRPVLKIDTTDLSGEQTAQKIIDSLPSL